MPGRIRHIPDGIQAADDSQLAAAADQVEHQMTIALAGRVAVPGIVALRTLQFSQVEIGPAGIEV